jgi:capsular exopolysaccharide synthesis family protein
MALRDESDLRRYLSVLHRRRGTVAMSIFLVSGAALLASLLQTPRYDASASVLVRAQPTASIGNEGAATGRVDATRTLENEIQFAESDAVRREVRAAARADGTLTVSAERDADVLVFGARTRHPATAVELANHYATTYIEMRRAATVQEFVEYKAVVQGRIDALRADRERLIGPLGALEQALAQLPLGDEAERRQLESQVAIETSRTAGQRASLDSQLASLEATAGELDLGPQLAAGGASLVREAREPREPAVPTTSRNVLMGLGVGAVLALALAFVLDQLDDSIRTREDLEEVSGVPAVGLIPRVPGWSDREEIRLVAEQDRGSPTAEAYRSLRTSVQFLGIERSIRSLMVTSPGGGEGKTTTVANLAVTLALAGLRVAVVDCDLRRPRAFEYFGLSNERGLTSALAEGVSISSVIQWVGPNEMLAFVAAGPRPPNPAEILASGRAEAAIRELCDMVDIVLVDAPPVLPVTDSLILSGYVDAVLLLATAQHTSRHHVQLAAELLRQVDAPLIGAVLNSVLPSAGYGYGYGYGYVSETPRRPFRPWPRRRNGRTPPSTAESGAEDPEGSGVISTGAQARNR